MTVTSHHKITICSIYVPPNHQLKRDERDKLIEQLPLPFIILGVFNAYITYKVAKEI